MEALWWWGPLTPLPAHKSLRYYQSGPIADFANLRDWAAVKGCKLQTLAVALKGQ